VGSKFKIFHVPYSKISHHTHTHIPTTALIFRHNVIKCVEIVLRVSNFFSHLQECIQRKATIMADYVAYLNLIIAHICYNH